MFVFKNINCIKNKKFSKFFRYPIFRYSECKKKCITCNDLQYIICKKCKGIGRYYENTKEYKCSCNYGIIKCFCN